jgi:hypothetical protein
MREKKEIYDQCYYYSEMVVLGMLIIESNDSRITLST